MTFASITNMDAITVEIVRNKIASLVEEMHYHFYRSGYSTIIRELRDFSCVILDRDGRLIVAPPMFFHAPVYRHLVGRILALYGPSREPGSNDPIRDGDVFVSNHPYEGGLPHVSDMAFVAPVFAGDELVAFAGTIAHKADVGGTIAGSTSANATEMYQEGLLDPADADPRRRPASMPTSSASSSATAASPHWCAATCWRRSPSPRWASRGFKELCARFGAATVCTAFAAILQGSADGLRAAIAKLLRPAGVRGRFPR